MDLFLDLLSVRNKLNDDSIMQMKELFRKAKESQKPYDFTAIISSCKFGTISIVDANNEINRRLNILPKEG